MFVVFVVVFKNSSLMIEINEISFKENKYDDYLMLLNLFFIDIIKLNLEFPFFYCNIIKKE